MSNVINRYIRLAFYSDLNGVRFLLFLSELFWVIALLLPSVLGMDGCFNRPTYRIMAHINPNEEVWAAVWLFSAAIQFYVLSSGKCHAFDPVVFACFNSILWWFVVISIGIH